MAMTLSFHENLDYAETGQKAEKIPPVNNFSLPSKEKIHFFAEKMRVPKFNRLVPRPRLTELLKKSSEQFRTTLITGRAGTGKTALAADYAKNYESVAWFSVETADGDWPVFVRYFIESLSKLKITMDKSKLELLSREISPFVESLFECLEKGAGEKPVLIVLDDLHNVFDAPWFTEIFHALLNCLPKNVHLLLLSRTKPSFPLWRLRSKQVLGTIDEKLLAFTGEETGEFFKAAGLSPEIAEQAFKESYGRISKLKQFARTTAARARTE